MVANIIPGQSATVGRAFRFAFLTNTFVDADGDTLTYTATQSDGSALPTWLSFEEATRTFSGTPVATGSVTVKVTAKDGRDGEASDEFDVTVTTQPTVTITTPDELTAGRPPR